MTSTLRSSRASSNVEPVSQRVVFPPPGYLPSPPSSARVGNQPTHLYDPDLYPTIECNADNSMFIDVMYEWKGAGGDSKGLSYKTVLFRWSKTSKKQLRESSDKSLVDFWMDFDMELQLSFSAYMGYRTNVLGLSKPVEYTLGQFDKVFHRGQWCYKYIQLE